MGEAGEKSEVVVGRLERWSPRLYGIVYGDYYGEDVGPWNDGHRLKIQCNAARSLSLKEGNYLPTVFGKFLLGRPFIAGADKVGKDVKYITLFEDGRVDIAESK